VNNSKVILVCYVYAGVLLTQYWTADLATF